MVYHITKGPMHHLLKHLYVFSALRKGARHCFRPSLKEVRGTWKSSLHSILVSFGSGVEGGLETATSWPGSKPAVSATINIIS